MATSDGRNCQPNLVAIHLRQSNQHQVDPTSEGEGVAGSSRPVGLALALRRHQSDPTSEGLEVPGPSRGPQFIRIGSHQQVDPTSEATAMIRASRSPSPTGPFSHHFGGSAAADAAAFLISSTSVGTSYQSLQGPGPSSGNNSSSSGVQGTNGPHVGPMAQAGVDLDNDLSVPSPCGPNSPVLFLNNRGGVGARFGH